MIACDYMVINNFNPHDLALMHTSIAMCDLSDSQPVPTHIQCIQYYIDFILF